VTDSSNFAEGPIIHTDFSYEDTYDFINTIPALFWRIELVQNKIEYLNNFELPGLGESSKLLLKNMDFSRKIIIEEDIPVFESFMKSAKDRKPTVAILRIKLKDGTIRWLKIAGHPDHLKSTYYMGYILDITDVVNYLRDITSNDSGIKGKIGLFDNPILLVRFSDKKIFAANHAALDILGYSHDEIQKLSLLDLFEDNIERYTQNIYEEILFHKRWNGSLSFFNKNGNKFSGETAIRSLSENGNNLLWISIYDITTKNKSTDQQGDSIALQEQDTHTTQIADKIKAAAQNSDIINMLNLFLENQPVKNLADSILYSDINIKKGNVITYGAGPSFESLELGEEYPYEGTIAENIVKHDLNYIIIEDTYKSIKPIDWALFIPKGVKSYYAVPFFEKGELKTVLIYCSKKASVFSEENTKRYKPQLSLFQEALLLLKKSKK